MNPNPYDLGDIIKIRAGTTPSKWREFVLEQQRLDDDPIEYYYSDKGEED